MERPGFLVGILPGISQEFLDGVLVQKALWVPGCQPPCPLLPARVSWGWSVSTFSKDDSLCVPLAPTLGERQAGQASLDNRCHLGQGGGWGQDHSWTHLSLYYLGAEISNDLLFPGAGGVEFLTTLVCRSQETHALQAGTSDHCMRFGRPSPGREGSSSTWNLWGASMAKAYSCQLRLVQ